MGSIKIESWFQRTFPLNLE
uniref:Uncharacterized protein n=1 Tax=Anguilla anguilla TaxID=7936 RepID=A0A0E9TIB1_ANGAN